MTNPEIVIRAYPTLYMVNGVKDGVIVLVVARDGEHAVKLCIEEGYDWARGRVHVVRIHKNVDSDCEVIDILKIAGGRGNAKNRLREFDGGKLSPGQAPI
jgi:hypothetical protein